MTPTFEVVPTLLPQALPPIEDVGEARTLLAEFEHVTDELIGVIEQESELVRAGRLYAATDLVERKQTLLADYLVRRTRIKDQAAMLARLLPEEIERLRDRHNRHIDAVRENLAVLSVAREVAEGIVRNVSTAVGRQSAPRSYGRNAMAQAPLQAAARGIAVDRRS